MQNINEHDVVIASCGTQVGKVDHLEGQDSIKLTGSDDENNEHHVIPLSWVAKAENGEVHLNKNAEEVHQQWKTLQ
ncbi:DUF2171 domain-containing protein [Acinetobacter radioresistens]|uniref:DUF2171 domain-containing protein n=1 Tax=Acinetobacter radioresistens TaxID=40216 RepID=UPI0021CDA1C4|nr:DUF2171 domain-containing protein [Acinetobacter radioresistens]MCU4597207.1 DUF2171 domain-containing protein [Acinetobacter radioresistens]